MAELLVEKREGEEEGEVEIEQEETRKKGTTWWWCTTYAFPWTVRRRNRRLKGQM